MNNPDPILFSPALETMRMPTRPVRLGVLASGSGSNFEEIVRFSQEECKWLEVVYLIVNRPDAKAIDRARRLNVAYEVIDHTTFSSRAAFDTEVARALKGQDVEWVAMAGWMRIASRPLLDAYPDRMMNLHPSLLPAFKGGHAVAETLASGACIAGCSVHLVNAQVDDGRIIAQAAVPVLDGDSEQSLHARIHKAEHLLYPRAIAHVVSLKG